MMKENIVELDRNIFVVGVGGRQLHGVRSICHVRTFCQEFGKIGQIDDGHDHGIIDAP